MNRDPLSTNGIYDITIPGQRAKRHKSADSSITVTTDSTSFWSELYAKIPKAQKIGFAQGQKLIRDLDEHVKQHATLTDYEMALDFAVKLSTAINNDDFAFFVSKWLCNLGKVCSQISLSMKLWEVSILMDSGKQKHTKVLIQKLHRYIRGSIVSGVYDEKVLRKGFGFLSEPHLSSISLNPLESQYPSEWTPLLDLIRGWFTQACTMPFPIRIFEEIPLALDLLLLSLREGKYHLRPEVSEKAEEIFFKLYNRLEEPNEITLASLSCFFYILVDKHSRFLPRKFKISRGPLASTALLIQASLSTNVMEVHNLCSRVIDSGSLTLDPPHFLSFLEAHSFYDLLARTKPQEGTETKFLSPNLTECLKNYKFSLENDLFPETLAALYGIAQQLIAERKVAAAAAVLKKTIKFGLPLRSRSSFRAPKCLILILSSMVQLSSLFDVIGFQVEAQEWLNDAINFAASKKLTIRAESLRNYKKRHYDDQEDDVAAEIPANLADNLKQLANRSKSMFIPELSKQLSLLEHKYEGAVLNLTKHRDLKDLPESILSAYPVSSNSNVAQQVHDSLLAELLAELDPLSQNGLYTSLEKRQDWLAYKTSSIIASVEGLSVLEESPTKIERHKHSYVNIVRQINASSGLDLDSTLSLTVKEEVHPDIPLNTIVVSLNHSSDGDLIISRFTSEYDVVSVTIPQLSLNPTDDESSLEGISDLHSCVESIESLTFRNTQLVDPEVSCESMRHEWWAKYRDLDRSLGDLLGRIQLRWLRGFTALFDVLNYRRNELFAIFKSDLTSAFTQGEEESQMELADWIPELFLGLGAPDSSEYYMDGLSCLVDFICSHLKFQSFSMKHGTSPPLFSKVFDIVKTYYSKIRVSKRKNELFIVPDALTQTIPWESLPFLAEIPVTRLTSLSMLSQCVKYKPQNNHVHYVLDPDNNIDTLQQEFKADFERRGWKGFTGKRPSDEEIHQILSSSDCFIHMGHGSGLQYISRTNLRRMQSCSPVLLFGCQSGKMILKNGHSNAFGPPSDFSLAGCPMLFGTLWSVGDKELNRFSQEFLRLAFDAGSSVCDALIGARKKCVFPYLTGAAAVLYGKNSTFRTEIP